MCTGPGADEDAKRRARLVEITGPLMAPGQKLRVEEGRFLRHQHEDHGTRGKTVKCGKRTARLTLGRSSLRSR